MSLYNAINGVNSATFFILPMLGEKHPDSYPRFRDCFVNTDGDKPEIHVFTRVGGGNRNSGFGENVLYKHPNFLSTFDDDFDSTFATYTFSVPEEWKPDFDLIMDGKTKEISQSYKERLYAVYPKLTETFNTLFNGTTSGQNHESNQNH